MSHRDEYIAKMKLQIDELNASVNKLELDAHAAKRDAETKYKEEMEKLRAQSRLAINKYPSIINLNSLMLLNNSILREMRPL